jgi:ribosomal protein S6
MNKAETTMKNYELTILCKIDSEEQTNKLLEQVKENLAKNQTNIKKDTLPTRIKLGYPIDKNHEAFMVSYLIESDEEQLEPIRTYLDFQDNIIRYTLINEKIGQAKAVRSRPHAQKPVNVSQDETVQIQQEEITESPTPEHKVEDKKEKKADLEEIDKKLEEMLNQ